MAKFMKWLAVAAAAYLLCDAWFIANWTAQFDYRAMLSGVVTAAAAFGVLYSFGHALARLDGIYELLKGGAKTGEPEADQEQADGTAGEEKAELEQ